MAGVTVTLEGWGVDVWDAGAWGQTSAGQVGYRFSWIRDQLQGLLMSVLQG